MKLTILGGFRGFLMQGVALLAVGYFFYWGYTTIYPQYADNYLYLGILAIAFTLIASFGLRVISKRR